MRLDMRGVDHLHPRRSPFPGKRKEQIFPDPALRPAHKTVIDRRRRPILGRAIAPAAAAFEHMHDAADHAAVIHPRLAPDVRCQLRFDPAPLLVRQPKQLAAHYPRPLSRKNHYRSVRAKELMSSNPSIFIDENERPDQGLDRNYPLTQQLREAASRSAFLLILM